MLALLLQAGLRLRSDTCCGPLQARRLSPSWSFSVLQVLGFEIDAVNSVQFSNHTGKEGMASVECACETRPFRNLGPWPPIRQTGKQPKGSPPAEGAVCEGGGLESPACRCGLPSRVSAWQLGWLTCAGKCDQEEFAPA